MSVFRRPALIVGLVSGVLGILFVASPAIASVVRIPDILLTLSLILVGVAAFVIAATNAFSGLMMRSDPEDGRSDVFEETPRPEGRHRYSRPGSEFVRRLDEIGWADRRADDPAARVALRAELTDVAVDVLSRSKGWTRPEIEAHLNEGTWTGDPRAAAFFADDIVPSLSKREYLRALVTGEPLFARRARHAMAELASVFDDSEVSSRIPPDIISDDHPPATIREFWPDQADSTPRDRLSGRVRGAVVASLVAGGFGIFVRQPGLLLLALFGIAVAGYARATSPPATDVEISRTVTETSPDPGQELTVSVSVRNAGDGVLPDLRLLDGVPSGLRVADGSPRFATALRSGKRATFSYTVEAVEGTHEFDPVLLIARDLAGVHERRVLAVGPSTRIECEPAGTPAVGFEPRSRTTVHSGRTRATIEGPGVEFHSIREYRPGDPRSRIDWNRKAKTGELATIDFLESRLARVVVLIDARAEAYLIPIRELEVPVVHRSVRAGRHIIDDLLDQSIPVGVAALSPRRCWVAPAAGEDHKTRLRNALTSSPALDWTPPEADLDVDAAVTELRNRLARNTQVVTISPLCDDEMKRGVQHLAASGRSVTVVSPDPTSPDGSTDCVEGYARSKRRSRLRKLREDGIAVIDWDPNTPFEEAIRRGH